VQQQQAKSPAANTAGQGGIGAKMKRHAPIMYIVGGVAFLLFWFIALMIQVQTSEAFLMHSPAQVNVMQPEWGIFMQIPNLLQGHLSSSEGKAALWAWGIEILFLGIFLGWEEMRSAVSPTGKVLVGIFEFGMIGIIIYNLVSDFLYANVGDTTFFGQLGFAVLASAMALFFAAIGVHFLLLGVKKTA
jgi:hypothetical protein